VVVSQSGTGAEITRLLAEGNAGAGHLLAVTNTWDSRLAGAAQTRVLTKAGEEATVACKSYVSAVTALLWISEVLAGTPAHEASRFVQLSAEAAADYLSWWREHVESLAGILSDKHQLYITGRGASLAAAHAGALTVKEAAHLATEAMTSAAFRHGPIEMAGNETAVFVLAGVGATKPLNRSLVADVRRLGGCAWEIGTESDVAALRLPQVPDKLLPLVEVLTLQMASLAIAALQGREAGRFTKASKITFAD
jgi:glucosamine--fructose-6-phosphate aminotransferase (isomerizing)